MSEPALGVVARAAGSRNSRSGEDRLARLEAIIAYERGIAEMDAIARLHDGEDADEKDEQSFLGPLLIEQSKIVVCAEFRDIEPEKLFDYWVKPELLQEWWPEEAEVEQGVGGSFHLSWPERNWHLRGNYTGFEQGRWLEFTWKWDHEPDRPMRIVTVSFRRGSAWGSLIMVGHGLYNDSAEDQEEKAGHLEGWLYFLGRLQAAIAGRAGEANAA